MTFQVDFAVACQEGQPNGENGNSQSEGKGKQLFLFLLQKSIIFS